LLIFESISTTFKPSIFFRDSWGSIENWIESKIKPSLVNLACPICETLWMKLEGFHHLPHTKQIPNFKGLANAEYNDKVNYYYSARRLIGSRIIESVG